MTPRHRSSIVVPGLLAVALIAAGCQDSTTTALKRPSFWGGQEQCPTAKFTGGGRIDSPPVNSMPGDRKSTRLNSSHSQISYAVFCLKKKNNLITRSPSLDAR